MLVLTRRPGEEISIGEEIVVRVLSVRGEQVQIGIEAPRSIRVDRGEIRAQIRAETEAARVSAADPTVLTRWRSRKKMGNRE